MNRTHSKTTQNKGYFGTATIWFSLAALAWIGIGLLYLQPSEAAEILVYKNPTCGCCNAWIRHLEEKGYQVKAQNRPDLLRLKGKLGIPRNLRSCHTARVEGYLIEGHVPAEDIDRLLAEKPEILGLAVPGMPMGSPGMEGPRKDAYSVIAFEKDGRQQVYASH